MEFDEFGREIPFGSDPSSERWRYTKAQQQHLHHPNSSQSCERTSLHWNTTPRKSFSEDSRQIRGHGRSWSPDTHDRRRDRKERIMTKSEPFKEDSPQSNYGQAPLLCERLWQDHATIVTSHNQSRVGYNRNQSSTGENSDEATSNELVAHYNKNEEVTINVAENGSSSYTGYVHNYCLEFVQTFLRHHYEESWLRQLYSPLGYRRMTVKFFEMASNEAGYMMQEATELGVAFITNARLGSGIKANIVSSGRELSLQKKRTHEEFMGNPSVSSLSVALCSSDRLNTIPFSHVHHALKKMAILKILQVPPFVSDLQVLRTLNELAQLSDNRTTTIEVISSPVINGTFGISAILASNMSNPWLSGINVAREYMSGSETNTSHDITLSNNTSLLAAWTNASTNNRNRVSDTFLYRTCWAILPTLDSKKKLLQTLTKMNDEMENSVEGFEETRTNYDTSSSRDTSHKLLKLFIDCSDPYGRFTVTENGKVVEKPAITQRKSTVLVVNDETSPQQISIAVLSAAISSNKRVQKDKESAISIARALDELRQIPKGKRIDDLLNIVAQLQSNDSSLSKEVSNLTMEKKQPSVEDLLDITIAYLRRVHLLSYYNGCKLSDNFGAALGTYHPVGTIYLRLKGADEILEKMDENTELGFKKYDDSLANDSNSNSIGNETDTTESPIDTDIIKKDMLVRLLDQSIDRALNCSTNILAKGGNNCILNNELNATADEIELLEEKTKVAWVNNHCLLDTDGRARCTFHFCRKLFKDKSFLEKHLIKKHDAYLEAALSKCHDDYITRVWTEDIHRPVPPVLVDCGSKFGFKPCMIRMIDGKYAIDDPEPELVRISEERIQLKLRREAEENRRREYYYRLNEERRNKKQFSDTIIDVNATVEPFMSVGHETNPTFSNKKNSFIDVDDMKDEKVMLSFDDIDLSKVSAKTTTKKKKKLL